MLEYPKDLLVELNTSEGTVFSGPADDVELKTTEGVIAINPREGNYLSFTQITHLTLRIGGEFLDFLMQNASASVRDGKLTVLAEAIHRIEPKMPWAG
jgi:F0F1-type ATP synthase epsilon subunit